MFQQNVDVLLQCLDIWITFLDFISTSLQCRKQDKVPEDSILVRLVGEGVVCTIV